VSDNKRNVDTDRLSPKSEGPQNPSGQGTRDRNRVESEQAAKDNRDAGRRGNAKDRS